MMDFLLRAAVNEAGGEFFATALPNITIKESQGSLQGLNS